MKKSLFGAFWILAVIGFFFLPLYSEKKVESQEFKRVGQWKLEADPFGKETLSILDKDNHLVCFFYQTWFCILTPEKVIKFGFKGEGPSDLMYGYAMFPYKGDIAVAEASNKFKIFTKKDGTYVWKATKWHKQSPNFYAIYDGVFVDNKFFLAGIEYTSFDKKRNLSEVYHVKVFDDNGKPLKHLVREYYKPPNRLYLLGHHIVDFKPGQVAFIPSDKLKVVVISTSPMKELREIQLEVPPYYKKRPSTFFIDKRFDSAIEFSKQLDEWDSGYSRVIEAVCEGNYLVISIRAFGKNVKKFTLLFYNKENFKLEKTVFTDDYLLDAKDGKYYCFANGDPGFEENADKCIINIYSFK